MPCHRVISYPRDQCKVYGKLRKIYVQTLSRFSQWREHVVIEVWSLNPKMNWKKFQQQSPSSEKTWKMLIVSDWRWVTEICLKARIKHSLKGGNKTALQKMRFPSYTLAVTNYTSASLIAACKGSIASHLVSVSKNPVLDFLLAFTPMPPTLNSKSGSKDCWAVNAVFV